MILRTYPCLYSYQANTKKQYNAGKNYEAVATMHYRRVTAGYAKEDNTLCRHQMLV